MMIIEQAVEIIILETRSKIGLIGYINEDGGFEVPTRHSKIWDMCHMPGKARILSRNVWGGVWSDCLINKRTTFSNQPLNPPPRHVPIDRAVCVPMMYEGELAVRSQWPTKQMTTRKKNKVLWEA